MFSVVYLCVSGVIVVKCVILSFYLYSTVYSLTIAPSKYK